MKKNALMTFFLALLISVILSGCEGSKSVKDDEQSAISDQNHNNNLEKTAKKLEDLRGEITVWKGYDNVSEMFMKKYPNVTVHMDKPPKSEDLFYVSLASGTGAADVMNLSQAHYWKFKVVDGLVNLLEEPYNAGEMKKDFVEAAWNMSMSLDGKRLYGLPWRFTPMVMMYRADIFENNGFPSAPEEVGRFIADPEQFFNMAQKMRNKDHYFFRSASEVTQIAMPSTAYFDNKLNFIRSGDGFVSGIDFAKRAAQLDLIYLGTKEEQDQALNSGRLIAYFGGIYRVEAFREGGEIGENFGKWRVTTLPFGQLTGLGYGTLVIPSQSKNKDLAWEYIKFVVTATEPQTIFMETVDLSAYRPNWNLPQAKEGYPAMGGQKVLEFGFSILDRVNYDSGVPLDKIAEEVWNRNIEEALTKNQDSRAVLSKIADEIEKAVSVEKAELLKALGR